MLIDKLECAGFKLKIAAAGKLSITGNLNDDQRAYIKKHKDILVSELKAKAEYRLERIAIELGWPVADLLDHYKDDLVDVHARAEIETMELKALRFMVKDYCQNYRACRNKPDPELLIKSREMK